MTIDEMLFRGEETTLEEWGDFLCVHAVRKEKFPIEVMQTEPENHRKLIIANETRKSSKADHCKHL